MQYGPAYFHLFIVYVINTNISFPIIWKRPIVANQTFSPFSNYSTAMENRQQYIEEYFLANNTINLFL
jgi:hypothetical protein